MNIKGITYVIVERIQFSLVLTNINLTNTIYGLLFEF